jgi:hypothetical protein
MRVRRNKVRDVMRATTPVVEEEEDEDEVEGQGGEGGEEENKTEEGEVEEEEENSEKKGGDDDGKGEKEGESWRASAVTLLEADSQRACDTAPERYENPEQGCAAATPTPAAPVATIVSPEQEEEKLMARDAIKGGKAAPSSCSDGREMEERNSECESISDGDKKPRARPIIRAEEDASSSDDSSLVVMTDEQIKKVFQARLRNERADAAMRRTLQAGQARA